MQGSSPSVEEFMWVFCAEAESGTRQLHTATHLPFACLWPQGTVLRIYPNLLHLQFEGCTKCFQSLSLRSLSFDNFDNFSRFLQGLTASILLLLGISGLVEHKMPAARVENVFFFHTHTETHVKEQITYCNASSHINFGLFGDFMFVVVLQVQEKDQNPNRKHWYVCGCKDVCTMRFD